MSAPWDPWHDIHPKIEAAIAAFKIGNPLKEMLKPEFTYRNHGWPVVQLTIHSLDSVDDTRRIWVSNAICVPDYFIYGFNEARFHVWLRDRIRWFLDHEMDESITVRGEKPFDPHRLPDFHRQTPES